MYGVAKEVVDQIIARRGKLHFIDRIDPTRSALRVRVISRPMSSGARSRLTTT